MEETTTRLIFRAGREGVTFDEQALRTAEQAKRRAGKKGQGRLQHRAALLVAAIKASQRTTLALEMVEREVSEVLEELSVYKDETGGPLFHPVTSRLEVLLGCLRSGEVEMQKPEPVGFWQRVYRFFFRRGK